MSSISSTNLPSVTARTRRFPIWIILVVTVLIVVVVGFAVVTIRMNYVPGDLDFSTTLSSELDLYQVSYVPELKPIPINQIHTWTLKITDPNGKPIENAKITVDGGMPQHGHGLPTAPQVTEYLGDGQYRVEGMKFHMTGWWVVKVKIEYNNTIDNVTFNLMLD